MDTKLNICLHGSLRSHIVNEFLTNSGHFPIALIFLELLMSGASVYLLEIDVYILLAGAMIQAYWLGYRNYIGRATPLLGNLLAPGIYMLGELILELDDHTLLEGVHAFFSDPHHTAYWLFAFTMGLIQSLRGQFPLFKDYLLFFEHLLRSLLLLLMYGIFESLYQPKEVYSLLSFFNDKSHVFIALVLTFSGILLGFAHLSIERLLILLRQTNAQLHTYSTWLLGENNLQAAVQDPASLSLQRRERSVLFMDIRGFTAWSETQTPEKVVAMLNQYFETAEECWMPEAIRPHISKIKFTGDEVMLVFADPSTAVYTAQCLRQRITTLLQGYELGAGIGLHSGALVEGLLGSQNVRGYDIIGDTVNTAKRICDHAKADEILLSQACYEALSPSPAVVETRQVKVKGKTQALELLVLE